MKGLEQRGLLLAAYRLVVTGIVTAGAVFLLRVWEWPPSLWLDAAAFVTVAVLISVLGGRLRRARADAETARRRYAATLESLNDAVITTDRRGCIVSLNGEAERLTGWTSLQAAGRPLADLFRIIDVETSQPIGDPVGYLQSRGTTAASPGRAILIGRDGQRTAIEVRAASIDPTGDPTGGSHSAAIAFREQTRGADQASACDALLGQELAAIASTAPGVLFSFRMHPDGRMYFPYASPTIRSIFGVDPDVLALDGAAAFARIHPDDFERVRTSVADAFRNVSEWRQEFRVIHPDTGEMRAEGRSTPARQDDGSVLWRGFFIDITKRKADELALQTATDDLRRSEARYRALAEAAQDAIFVIGLDGRYEYVNRAAASVFNRHPDEVTGKRVDEMFPPGPAADIMHEVQELERTGKPFYSERPLRFGDRETWQSAWLAPIFDDGLKVSRVVGIARDITESRQMAALLKRQHAVVDAIVQASPAGIALLHGDAFVCDLANPALQQLVPNQSIAGAPFRTWWPGDAVPLLEMFERVRATGVPEEAGDVTIQATGTSNEPRTVALLASRVQSNGDQKPGVLILASDITNRKSLERQFFQAQKMEAVGRLAGGIAHDFNNLLTSILGYTDLVIQTLERADPRLKDMEDIRKAGLSAAALTRQLLTFSRRDTVVPKALDINASLARLQQILTRTLGEDVKVTFQLESGVGAIAIDQGQLEQVLMNLTVNARDAMPHGGTLTIQTANVRLDHGVQALRAWVPAGNYVVLRVTDTGCGMTPMVQAHLFEPFFTTKAFGKGTGLGLSTVYGIVQHSNGFIAVASEPDRGTTFTIYLPRIDQPAHVAAEPASEPLVKGHETILIAEDNDLLRELTKRTLEACGYTTIAAKDAQEAIQLAEAFPGNINLLFTDVVMPGKDGLELSRELARRRPGMRVLFMSGYTDETISRHGLLNRGVQFLQKPFTRAAVTRKVREALDAAPAEVRASP